MGKDTDILRKLTEEEVVDQLHDMSNAILSSYSELIRENPDITCLELSATHPPEYQRLLRVMEEFKRKRFYEENSKYLEDL